MNTKKNVSIDEVASEVRLLLPEYMSSFSKYAVGEILDRLDDKIKLYIDNEMDAKDLAGYFDLGEIFEMLQQGVDEAVGVVSSFRKVCIVSMQPYYAVG